MLRHVQKRHPEVLNKKEKELAKESNQLVCIIKLFHFIYCGEFVISNLSCQNNLFKIRIQGGKNYTKILKLRIYWNISSK